MQSSRKPRLVVTGEFSAGKTRLINGLVGKDVLPSNVVSTSLPPIWLVDGVDALFRIDLSGEAHRIESLENVTVEDTLACLKSVDADILKHIDIIDTPGNSDPNIPAESWERMIGYADMLVWCTGATQAWRQSEKSTVRDLPEVLLENATLLITQADRIIDENSASKLKRRVTRDAEQYFDAILMASLLKNSDVETLCDHVIAKATSLKALPGSDFELIEVLRPKAKKLASPWRLEAALEAGKAKEDDPESKAVAPKAAKPAAPVEMPEEPRQPPEVVRAEQKPDEARKAPSSVRALWHVYVDSRALKDPADIQTAYEGFLDGIDKLYRLVPIEDREPLKLSASNRVRSTRRPSQRREITARN